jgi:hypothetical protein
VALHHQQKSYMQQEVLKSLPSAVLLGANNEACNCIKNFESDRTLNTYSNPKTPMYARGKKQINPSMERWPPNGPHSGVSHTH